MSGNTRTRRTSTPPGEASRDVARRDLARAWVAVAVSFAVVLAAAIWGPRPGDSVAWLVAQLIVIGAFGLGGAVAAIALSVRALRLGRNGAIAPLITAAFLVFQALLRVLGTLGRFYEWG